MAAQTEIRSENRNMGVFGGWKGPCTPQTPQAEYCRAERGRRAAPPPTLPKPLGSAQAGEASGWNCCPRENSVSNSSGYADIFARDTPQQLGLPLSFGVVPGNDSSLPPHLVGQWLLAPVTASL